MERRETLFSLEANHDQVSSVMPSELEGMSEANGCTQSLGGMEAPEPLVVARIPCGSANPQRGCPGVCGVEMCVYECGKMHAEKHG